MGCPFWSGNSPLKMLFWGWGKSVESTHWPDSFLRIFGIYFYICRLKCMERKRRSSPHSASLLAVLVKSPRGWRYGYELSQETKLESGTFYPILMRLSDRGVLESKWESSPKEGRPPRHMYRLTPQGVTYAKEEMTRYAGLSDLGRRGFPA